MANFLDNFPRILYRSGSGFQSITNITFRVGFIRGILENASAYYYYTIRDGDTPEILAEKIYGNAEAYWIILYANDIYDPFYDWPLNDRAFFKYLADKYRGLAESYLGSGISDQQVVNWTQDTTSADSVHHYEKRIVRTNTTDNTVLEINVNVNRTNLTSELNSSLPIANTASSAGREAWQYYTDYTGSSRALEYSGSYETFDNVAGKTVTQVTSGAAVTYYDHELAENEKKRRIRIIKAEYYPQLIKEFNELTNTRPAYVRKLV